MTGGGKAAEVASAEVQNRAALTLGTSGDAIYRMADAAIRMRAPAGGVLVDVGCGTGNLWRFVHDHIGRYIGVDVVAYDDYPAEAEFLPVDLESGRVPLESGTADVAAAIETIEHLENPRSLVRELARIAKPGGWVMVTTPNQLGLLSLATLIVRGEFSAFQDIDYPKHLSALLPVDLIRIGRECGLRDLQVHYSHSGRIPLTAKHFPPWLARRFPRRLSDNVLLVGRKPA